LAAGLTDAADFEVGLAFAATLREGACLAGACFFAGFACFFVAVFAPVSFQQRGPYIEA